MLRAILVSKQTIKEKKRKNNEKEGGNQRIDRLQARQRGGVQDAREGGRKERGLARKREMQTEPSRIYTGSHEVVTRRESLVTTREL